MKKLGIITALSDEAEGLISSMTDKKEEKINYMLFADGKIGDTEVTVVTKAYGKVNAAMAAQLLIMKYGAKMLINTGVGGGLGQGLMPGDTVLADKVVQHDIDTTALGDERGLISGLYRVYIDTDRELTEKLYNASLKLGYSTRKGIIATGDSFIATNEQRKRITDAFGALVCEMEGGAVGQAAALHNVPFAVLRAISDNGDGDAPADYNEFTKSAASKAVSIILSLLGKEN